MPDSPDAVIDCRSLWQVFGARADEAMRAIRERGLGKDEEIVIHPEDDGPGALFS